MRIISSIFYLILIALAVVFAVINSNEITLAYYFGTQDMPLSLALAIALILGCLLGVLSCLKKIIKLKYCQRQLKQEINTANKEISNLRAIPIKDQH